MQWPHALSTVALAACTWCAAQAQPVALDAQQLAEAALGELPGVVAVGVLREGNVETALRRRERAGDPLQPWEPRPGAEPIFEIGSISKVFTGLLVAQQVEQGRLGLDDTLATLLQGRVPFRYERVTTLPVRHLLTHRACLPHWPASFTGSQMFEQATKFGREGLWSLMGQYVLGRSPPCETKYSNVGFAVLGQALAERAQRPWEDLVLEGIVQPLGLRDTRVQLSPAQQARLAAPSWNGTFRAQPWAAGVFAPAGGLHSTVGDLLAFSQALLQGRQGPLGAAAERLVSDLAPYGEDGARIGYGVMLPQGPVRAFGHSGRTRGFSAEWIVWPERRQAVVLLASNQAAPVGKIRRALLDQTWTGTVQEVIYTRGEFRGSFTEDGGRRVYARVKLAPGRQVPFSTLTYRLRDGKLVQGLQPGTQVDFRAERIDGENTITELRLPP